MSRAWEKIGQIYCPTANGRHPKLISHAANPLPVLLKDDIYRIYYSGRDSEQRSSVGAVDVDIVQHKIVREYYAPFFEHGPEGSFFEHGVSIGNCYNVNGQRYMLFMGWKCPNDEHWYGQIGRIMVNQDFTLSLESDQPFIELDDEDSVSLSYPFVQKVGNNGYYIWYGSTLTWDAGNGEMLHVIKFSSSLNGHTWNKKGVAIPYEIGNAQAFSRPTVIGDLKNGFEMWFSYRGGNGGSYRIGYARSVDGKNWELALDETGIDVSSTGWDSEMIEYPFVFEHKGKRYMLYNGNGYGLTGFGLAIQE